MKLEDRWAIDAEDEVQFRVEKNGQMVDSLSEDSKGSVKMLELLDMVDLDDSAFEEMLKDKQGDENE